MHETVQQGHSQTPKVQPSPLTWVSGQPFARKGDSMPIHQCWVRQSHRERDRKKSSCLPLSPARRVSGRLATWEFREQGKFPGILWDSTLWVAWSLRPHSTDWQQKETVSIARLPPAWWFCPLTQMTQGVPEHLVNHFPPFPPAFGKEMRKRIINEESENMGHPLQIPSEVSWQIGALKLFVPSTAGISF